MRWYEDLYMGYKAMNNKEKIIENINSGKFQLDKFVFALPFNDHDVLDIYPSYVLMQKRYLDSDLMIIGIADGQEEANDVLQLIIMDCFNETNSFKLKKFILNK